MIKKIKLLFLFLINIILNNSLNSMEIDQASNIENSDSAILQIAPEIRYIIIKTFIESNINNWGDIFTFDKESLKQDLNRIALICKTFNPLSQNEIKSIINKAKPQRFQILYNQIIDKYNNLPVEVLNEKLIAILSKSYNIKKATKLIIAGADSETKNMVEETTLTVASKIGAINIVEILINLGADINAKNICNMTPLMEATHMHHVKISKLLINKGADVNAEDLWGNTALMFALRSNTIPKPHSKKIVKLLLNYQADVTPRNADETDYDYDALWLAIFKDRNDYDPDDIHAVVSLLLDKGEANIDTIYAHGETILTALISDETLDESYKTLMVIQLLQYNPNLNIENDDQKTALDLAKENDLSYIVKLIENKKNKRIRTN